MQPHQKMILKAQLTGLQALSSSLGPAAMVSKNLANIPIITPAGPISIPAFVPICGFLEQQDKLNADILKFLGTVIDAM